jgi:Flp pilus assembly pilin Flp
MYAPIQKLLKDESGQGVPEYALIVAFVAVMVALVGGLWSGQMQTMWTTIAQRMSAIVAGA